jgi:hypothetical protein
MTGSLYSKTRPRTELYCRNIDGDIVIVSRIWKGVAKGKTAVSLYVARGIQNKMMRLIHREVFDNATNTKDMLEAARDTVAHLWALHYGISDYVVVYKEPLTRELYHPTELQQEKQP